jgi:hypothetical protein
LLAPINRCAFAVWVSILDRYLNQTLGNVMIVITERNSFDYLSEFNFSEDNEWSDLEFSEKGKFLTVEDNPNI